jgi:hypothetical protein
MYKGKGRPPNKIECIRKTIYLRIDLCDALKTYPNQTKAIQEALENYIFFKDKSDEVILNEIETHQKIIKGLQSRLINNKKLREQEKLDKVLQREKEKVFEVIFEKDTRDNDDWLKDWSQTRLKRINSNFQEYKLWREKAGKKNYPQKN